MADSTTVQSGLAALTAAGWDAIEPTEGGRFGPAPPYIVPAPTYVGDGITAALRQRYTPIPQNNQVLGYPTFGKIIYVDPSAANNGDGSTGAQAASGGAPGAFNTMSSVTWAVGQTVLVAAGTTIPSAVTIDGVTNATIERPVVFGIYSKTTLKRIYNPRPGSATVNAGATAFGIKIQHGNFVCVEGFKVTNTIDSATEGGITHRGQGSNNQILNCDVRGLAGTGIYFDIQRPSGGHVIQGNLADGGNTGAVDNRHGIVLTLSGDRSITPLTTNAATTVDTPTGNVLSFAAATNVEVGQLVASGTSIAKGTRVTAISGGSVTLSQPVIATVANGASVSFTFGGFAYGVKVRGNSACNMVRGHGIYIASNSDASAFVGLELTDNVCSKNIGGSGMYSGIQIATALPYGTVARNQCNGNGKNGIGITCSLGADATGMLVQDNDCHNNGMGIALLYLVANGYWPALCDLQPGGSKFAWTAPCAGTVTVSGGTVSDITLTEQGYRDASVASSTPLTAGSFKVSAGSLLVVTYSGTPSIRFVPSFKMHGEPWSIEGNRCWYNGSNSNTSPAITNASAYGRNIEVYGTDFNTRCENGVIRFNDCRYAYNWAADGSEGVGIGLDNYCYGIDVYANYVAFNEGAGLQFGTGSGCSFRANVTYHNHVITRGGSVTDSSDGEIVIFGVSSSSSHLEISNNTIICGSDTGKHGITESYGGTCAQQRWYNNVIVGATGAGVNYLAADVTPTANQYWQCATNAKLSTALGNGASQSLDGASITTAPTFVQAWYAPTSGSTSDKAGQYGHPAVRGMNGIAFGVTPPIGANAGPYLP